MGNTDNKIMHIPGYRFTREDRSGLICDMASPDGLGQGDQMYGLKYCDEGEGHFNVTVSRPLTERYTMFSFMSRNSLALQPNRPYRISVKIRCDFDRNSEVNIGLLTRDTHGRIILSQVQGFPNKTDGWSRWTWDFISDPMAVHATFKLDVYSLQYEGHFDISNLEIEELPVVPLLPYVRGEGVTFRGGPGNLPMAVEEVIQEDGGYSVRTTGAKYIFNSETGVITGEQLIGMPRPVAEFVFSVPLSGLEILRQDNTVCILANDYLTLGIQCDGLIMVSPQKDTEISVISKIGGKWNRLAGGHLMAYDGKGGFAVNPDIPRGTGRQNRVDCNTRSGRVPLGALDFCGKMDDALFVSKAAPGWKVRWFISPGERIALSVFPPKHFPWEESFKKTFAISDITVDKEFYEQYKKYARAVILWDFFKRSWGMSYSPQYPVNDEELLRNHIRMAKEAGLKPIPYMTGWFYFSRDPAVFGAEVRRMRDDYGFEGCYFDGLPTESWVVAYEEARLAREVFPDGMIVLHHTYPAPLMEDSVELPAIASYVDMTFMGEGIHGYGKNWVYPGYFISQYNKANCIGIMKSDKWFGPTPIQRDLLMLGYNARACPLPTAHEGLSDENRLKDMEELYMPTLDRLEKLWHEKGDLPDFFESVYLPALEEMVKPHVGELPAQPQVETGEYRADEEKFHFIM